ncbi:phosphoglycerate kinase [Candidatus Oleimmundimicrobium sp.]|uniref:phosphoglycerate kinase n=1 Tax=Candidatus Oleimmundimicrobium sp. TaxID=3060597 RepID=UPI002725ECB1|nr:phosphoglycerate kinase [Candidatus Oleimmundimicrobium sp.]MDO8885708.1 phosphoglycerate kinase [Candidatus Oleimmundimicrobium sp.]
MFSKKTIRDVDVTGKRVLVRVDFNVPLTKEREVADSTRIRAVLPTINYLVEREAKIILISHLGRPDGKVDDAVRMDPVARCLSNLLGKQVQKVDKTVTDEVKAAVSRLKTGDVLLLENVRFNPGEKKNDPEFAKQLALLADIYVNDAFGTAHRNHASTVGITNYLPAYGGFLLEKEINELSKLFKNPDKPFVAVLGGNKVSDKIKVIEKFLDIVDVILTGGGMCFTFLKAKGANIGGSICQNDETEHSLKMLKKAKENGVGLLLPVDVVVAKTIAEDAEYKIVPVENIPDKLMGLDIGPKTIRTYEDILSKAKTIFWNGPMGVFEIEQFSQGTKAIATAIANSQATTIVGGGDSDAALRKYGLENRVSFISTGGGASLKFLEGTPLPGAEALLDK